MVRCCGCRFAFRVSLCSSLLLWHADIQILHLPERVLRSVGIPLTWRCYPDRQKGPSVVLLAAVCSPAEVGQHGEDGDSAVPQACFRPCLLVYMGYLFLFPLKFCVAAGMPTTDFHEAGPLSCTSGSQLSSHPYVLLVLCCSGALAMASGGNAGLNSNQGYLLYD